MTQIGISTNMVTPTNWRTTAEPPIINTNLATEGTNWAESEPSALKTARLPVTMLRSL